MPQLLLVPDYFITDSSAGPDNKARYSNKHVDELFKFHANDLPPHGTIRHQHAVPGFQIPGQRSDHHIGPVGNKAVAGRLNGPNCVFELLDVVLMVRPAPIKFDELLFAHLHFVCDGKEIPNVIEKLQFALCHFYDFF